MPDPIAARFATAVAGKDTAALTELLAPDVDFKALTPRKFWDGSAPADVLDALFAHWFDDDDRIDALVAMTSHDPVEDTEHCSYRLAITTPDGPHTVEQQAYFRTVDGRISYLRVLCSGYRPVAS
jgi:hypothetical protein